MGSLQSARGCAFSDSMQTQFDVDHLLKGARERVETRYGPVCVTVSGDRRRTPCVTYHDVGLNHQSCFTSLLVCSSSASASPLLQNLCFYHIDVPGCGEGADSVPEEILPMTLEKLAEQLEDVIQHYKLSPCMGMGVGAGGYVLALHAAKYQQTFFALVLLSPACLRASWRERLFGSAMLKYMSWRGIDRYVADHFVHRLVSGRSADLAHTVQQAVLQMSPQGLHHYFSAVLTRHDLTARVNGMGVERLLLIWGYEALYKNDCHELNRAIVHKDRVGWAEVDQCAVLATEECPFRILEEMKFFVKALQGHGHCLDWKID